MIEESAQVVSIDGQFAWVETQRKSACGSCGASAGCGTATLQKVMGAKRTQLKALNSANAQLGDQVVIGVDEQAFVKGSLAVYAVPLLMMLVFALVAEWWFASEGLTIISGLLGLLVGFFWLKHFTARISHDEQYQAVVLRTAAPQSAAISFHK
jgi:sigma-E factor negative regulatory protein RseC